MITAENAARTNALHIYFTFSTITAKSKVGLRKTLRWNDNKRHF